MKLRDTLTALTLSLALTASFAQAGKFLGIHSADGNSPGGIYEIDAETGSAAKIYDVDDDLIGQQWSGNGLALDAVNHRVYYTSFPGDLYVYDIDEPGNRGFLVDLEDNVASGAVYDEEYYYFVQGTGELKKVTFGSGAPVVTSLATYQGYRCDYGDIAIRDGMLFASGDHNGTSEFFKINLDDHSLTSLNSDMPSKYQLAFVDDELIGIDTGTDEIFSIDLQNGDTTKLNALKDSQLVINDAAPALPYAPPAVVPVAPVALPALAVLGVVCIKRRWARA